MNGLIPIVAPLVTGLLQAVLRGGSRASAVAPTSLRRLARGLVPAGVTISILPLLPLAMDVAAVRSPGELGIMIAFLLLSLALILPAWIWVNIVLNQSNTRSAVAFALSATTVNIGITVLLYRGLFSGDPDSQDGIVVLLVPLFQIAVVATAALIRRTGDATLTKRTNPAAAGSEI